MKFSIFKKKVDYVCELRKIEKWHWIEIHNTLNGWDWPEQLNHVKPDWWDGEDKKDLMDRKQKIIVPIHDEIEKLFTRKERLKYHHIHNMGRTEEEFEMWWWLMREDRYDEWSLYRESLQK